MERGVGEGGLGGAGGGWVKGWYLLVLWLCPDVKKVTISCKGIAAIMGSLIQIMIRNCFKGPALRMPL